MFKIKLKRFALYSVASLVAMVVDFTLFILFSYVILKEINVNISVLLSTIIARVASATINFFLSRKALQSTISKRKGIVKYFTLTAIQTLLSAGLVILLYNLTHLYRVLLKCIVDTSLYFASYKVQFHFIFHKKGKMQEPKQA